MPFGGLNVAALFAKQVQLKDELDEFLVANLKESKLAVQDIVVYLNPDVVARESPASWTPAALSMLDQINTHALLTSAHLASANVFDSLLAPPCLHPLLRAHLHSAIESAWISCRAAIKLDQLPGARDYAPTLFLSLLGQACFALQRLGASGQSLPFAINVLALLRNYGIASPYGERLYKAANLWCHYVEGTKAVNIQSVLVGQPHVNVISKAYDEARASAVHTDLVATQVDQTAALLRSTAFSAAAESRHRLFNQLTVFLQAEERDRIVRDPLELHPSCLPNPMLIVTIASATRPTLCALAGRLFESLLIAPGSVDDRPSFCAKDVIDEQLSSAWHPKAVVTRTEPHVRWQYLQRLLNLGEGKLIASIITLFKRAASSRSVLCPARCITTIVINCCTAFKNNTPPIVAAPVFDSFLSDFSKALLLMLFIENSQIRFEALIALAHLHSIGLKDVLLDQTTLDQVRQIVTQPRGSFPYELVLASIYLLQVISLRCSDTTRFRDFVLRCSLSSLMKWSELYSVRARLISLISCLAQMGDLMTDHLTSTGCLAFLLSYAHEAGNSTEIQRAVWLLYDQRKISAPNQSHLPLITKLLEETDATLKLPLTVDAIVPVPPQPFKIQSLLFRAMDLYLLGARHQEAARVADFTRCFHGAVALCRDILRWVPRHSATIAFLTRTGLVEYL